MRITWKDSITYKQYTYRKHTITKHGGGWIVDLEGDNNIYFSIDCAHNAIDKRLGGNSQKGSSKRIAKGIKIIGTIEQRGA